MHITDVRVRLIGNEKDRLKAVCSVTLDGAFVVRDVKVVEGTGGLFVAMPSRKLSTACHKCGTQNHLRAQFCNECGTRLPEAQIPSDDNGREKTHRDIAHPITASFRQEMQERVLDAFEDELHEARRGAVREYDEEYDEDYEEGGEDQPVSEYDALIAGLRNGGRGDTRRKDEPGRRDSPRRDGGRREETGRGGGGGRPEGKERRGRRGGRGRGRGRDEGSDRGGRGGRGGERSERGGRSERGDRGGKGGGGRRDQGQDRGRREPSEWEAAASAPEAAAEPKPVEPHPQSESDSEFGFGAMPADVPSREQRTPQGEQRTPPRESRSERASPPADQVDVGKAAEEPKEETPEDSTPFGAGLL